MPLIEFACASSFPLISANMNRRGVIEFISTHRLVKRIHLPHSIVWLVFSLPHGLYPYFIDGKLRFHRTGVPKLVISLRSIILALKSKWTRSTWSAIFFTFFKRGTGGKPLSIDEPAQMGENSLVTDHRVKYTFQ